MNNTTKNVLEAVLVASLLVAALSFRAHAADVPQVHVKYSDLNIANPAGAAVLYQRIRHAANQVCDIPDQRELARLGNVKLCVDQAIAGAVAAVESDTLTDIYQAKTRNVAFVAFASN